MFKFGLKLFSINKNYLKSAQKIIEKNLIDYIELYIVPNSFNKYYKLWQELKIPYIIHAPDVLHGLDISINKSSQVNIIKEVQKFADFLSAKKIIFHPGLYGTLKESVLQIQKINDRRIIIENMPYFSLIKNKTSLGAKPEEIKRFVTKKIEFCLDISHAICAANALKIKKNQFIKKMLLLKPKLYHLSDGNFEGVVDEHKNIGQGNFPFELILNWLPVGSLITLETQKNYKRSLTDFETDIKKIKYSCLKIKIRIRKAKKRDGLDLWKWRNNQKVRKWCINNKNISLKEHNIWLNTKLTNKNSQIYIAENTNHEKLGQIRFEKEGGRGSININLNPKYINMGLGSRIIRTASKIYFKENHDIKIISAIIMKQNIRSKKAFLNAGFYELKKGKKLIELIYKNEYHN